MTPRTCALCGERDAATLTDLDGRAVPACARCLSPVPDPARPYEPADPIDRFAPSPKSRRRTTTRDAVIAVVAKAAEPIEPAQIAAAVGAPCPGTSRDGKRDRDAWRPYEAVLACLARAVKRGDLIAEWINPAAPNMGRRYAIPERARC